MTELATEILQISKTLLCFILYYKQQDYFKIINGRNLKDKTFEKFELSQQVIYYNSFIFNFQNSISKNLLKVINIWS